MTYVIKVGNLYFMKEEPTGVYQFTQDILLAEGYSSSEELGIVSVIAQLMGGTVVPTERASEPTVTRDDYDVFDAWLRRNIMYILYSIGDTRAFIQQFTRFTANTGECDVTEYVGVPCVLRLVAHEGATPDSILYYFALYAYGLTAISQKTWGDLPYGIPLTDGRRILTTELDPGLYEQSEFVIPLSEGGNKLRSVPARSLWQYRYQQEYGDQAASEVTASISRSMATTRAITEMSLQ